MYSQNVFILGRFWIYKVRSSTVDTKTKYLCIVICPKKFTLAQNVFEVIALCRTRADILKPRLDRTLALRKALKYEQNPQCRSFGVDIYFNFLVHLTFKLFTRTENSVTEPF